MRFKQRNMKNITDISIIFIFINAVYQINNVLRIRIVRYCRKNLKNKDYYELLRSPNTKFFSKTF